MIVERHEPSQTEPDRTEPWYFRKATVTGHTMYAFQADNNKTNRSQKTSHSQNRTERH